MIRVIQSKHDKPGLPPATWTTRNTYAIESDYLVFLIYFCHCCKAYRFAFITAILFFKSLVEVFYMNAVRWLNGLKNAQMAETAVSCATLICPMSDSLGVSSKIFEVCEGIQGCLINVVSHLTLG